MGGRSVVVPPKFVEPSFTDRTHLDILTTTVYSLSSYSSSATPWLIAAVDAGADKPLHPLTFKPHPNLPENFNFSYFRTSSLASFHHADDIPFDKIIVAFPKTDVLGDNTMVALYGGGQLIGRLPHSSEWVKLSGNCFADIVFFMRKIYAVDIQGKLFPVNFIYRKNSWRLGKLVVSKPVIVSDGCCWMRLAADANGGQLYLVVCLNSRLFKVYKLMIESNESGNWVEVRKFDGGKVLFVSKDCCFFTSGFGGREYRNCIVFSKACFGGNPPTTDEIGVFRISDKRYGIPGESVGFPEIDWSPPSWIFDVGSCSVSQSHSQTEGDPNESEGVDSNSRAEKHGGVQSNLKLLNSEDEEEQTEEDLMNAENEAVETESSRGNVTPSVSEASTSSTSKSCKGDSTTSKFEGFEIRSDLVPILEKIWREHGNIVENSTIRSGDIVAMALESLATMVQILEDNSDKSLSDCQAGYLNSTLSDLRCLRFKVDWLAEMAVNLQKSKDLVESLNKLSESSSRVKESKAVLLEEIAKLNTEESRLKAEMAKVSKMIPFSGQLNFDVPIGCGLD